MNVKLEKLLHLKVIDIFIVADLVPQVILLRDHPRKPLVAGTVKEIIA